MPRLDVCKRLPDKHVDVSHIPKGTPIVGCGHVYIAKLPDGPAVVLYGRSQNRIEAQSRLRRAAIRGTFAGVKRRRRRR